MLQTLFVHCTLGHGGMWRGLIRALPGLEAVTVDLPDHGRGPARDPGQDLHDQATALALAALPEGPCAVIGHSFGGTVALRVALERRAQVRALVLIEPMVLGMLRRFDPAAFAQSEAMFRPVLDLIAAGDRPAAARLFLDQWGQAGGWDAALPAQREVMAGQMGFVAATRPIVEDDSPGLLAPGGLESLDIPVLLLCGETSPSPMASIQRGLAARLPDATAVMLPGLGHMAPLSDPGPVADAIRDWGGLG